MARTLRAALLMTLPLWLGCAVDASGLAGADLGDASFDVLVDGGDDDASLDTLPEGSPDDTLVEDAPDGSLFEVGAPCVDPKTDCPTPSGCSQAICSGGFCGVAPLPARTACASGGGRVCDGAGACIACVADPDCPGYPANVCSSATCVAASCGDGKKDGTETDVDCGGGCAKCALGKACGAAGDCASGKCLGAKCVCANDGQCGAGRYCDAASACKNQIVQGKACTRAGECATGFCVDGFCCNVACTGACRACSGALRGGGAANDGTCGAVKDNTDPKATCALAPPCGNTGVCSAGACKLTAAGASCGAASCLAGTATAARTCDGAGACSPPSIMNCAPYVCDVGGKCKTTCLTSLDCETGSYCSSTNVCTAKKLSGTACALGAECNSGNCVDGVCCDSTCVGLCRACNVAGSAGTCSMLEVSVQEPTCTGVLACDGKGNCLSASGEVCTLGTTCASGVCDIAGSSGKGTCR